MLEDNLGGEVGVWCIKRVQFLRDMFQWLSPVVATRDKHSLFSLWPDCLAFVYVTFTCHAEHMNKHWPLEKIFCCPNYLEYSQTLGNRHIIIGRQLL